MRDDLDFLYQKAMRSTDIDFMNEVFMLLIDNDEFKMAHLLDQRLDNIMVHFGYETTFTYIPSQTKFDFLVGDSQRGADWYRNR